MTSDSFDELMRARWSCRAFLPRQVPRDTISAMVETAQRAPSWNNTQPWQLIITSGDETDRFRDALFEHAGTAAPAPDLEWPSAYPGVLGERRRACGWQLYGALGIEKGDRAASGKQMMENFRFFGAPHMVIVTAPRALGSYGALDCGAFLAAFCLAAQAHGVATIAQAAVAAHGGFLREWFDIPEDQVTLFGIAFGYADETHAANSYRTERAGLDEIVDWRG